MTKKETHITQKDTRNLLDMPIYKLRSKEFQIFFETPEGKELLKQILNIGKIQLETFNELALNFPPLELVETIKNLQNVFISFASSSGFVKTFVGLDSLIKNYDPTKIIDKMELSKIDMDIETKNKLYILEEELKITIKNKCYFSVSVILGTILDVFLLDFLILYEKLNPDKIKEAKAQSKNNKKPLSKITLGGLIDIYLYLYDLDGKDKKNMLQLKHNRDISHTAKMPNDLYTNVDTNISRYLLILFFIISDISENKKKLVNKK